MGLLARCAHRSCRALGCTSRKNRQPAALKRTAHDFPTGCALPSPGNVLLSGHVGRRAAQVDGRGVLVQPHIVNLRRWRGKRAGGGLARLPEARPFLQIHW